MQDLDRRPAARERGAAATTSGGPRAPRWPWMRRAMPSRWVALTLLASAQLMLVLDVIQGFVDPRIREEVSEL